jgi:hypothetical protein
LWRNGSGTLLTAETGAPPGSGHADAAPGESSGDRDEAQLHTAVGDARAPYDAPGLFLVTSWVPPGDEAEFDDWFDTEHVPLLLRVPGWRAVRRYRVIRSTRGATHLALHYLDGAEVLKSPGRTSAAQTAWTQRMAARPWFRDNVRAYYQAVTERNEM